MEKKNKGVQAVDDNVLEVAAGGFAGKDKYSQAEYNKYGITHQNNTWSKDEYWYQGKKISQKQAEKKVESAMEMGSKGVDQVYGR